MDLCNEENALQQCIRRIQRRGYMVLFTRSSGESIIIDGDTTVTVLGIKGNQVRLAITTPNDFEVQRVKRFI